MLLCFCIVIINLNNFSVVFLIIFDKNKIFDDAFFNNFRINCEQRVEILMNFFLVFYSLIN